MKHIISKSAEASFKKRNYLFVGIGNMGPVINKIQIGGILSPLYRLLPRAESSMILATVPPPPPIPDSFDVSSSTSLVPDSGIGRVVGAALAVNKILPVHVAHMGESRNAYRVLVGRPEGKRPLGRPRRRWEDNIKMDLREVGYDDRDWINLAQDRDQWRAYVRAAMNLRDNTEGFELNGLHQLLVYADDVNVLGKNPQTIRENTEILLEASKAICLEVNPEKTSLLSKNLKVKIYKTVILPVVLYGCETWALTFREEQRLRVFENKVLRKIFGAKRDEVTGDWRKLHNAKLHALYSSPDIIRNIKSRRLRWAGHVTRMGESRNAYRMLVGRPEGMRPLSLVQTDYLVLTTQRRERGEVIEEVGRAPEVELVETNSATVIQRLFRKHFRIDHLLHRWIGCTTAADLLYLLDLPDHQT
ncbi:hypothetical protein ANN_01320 [Periplaneta americana]|uniref:Reverse transcriptase domain-containing protein n=1 Tax=Periplaneta americana TaxID=6978 RepID=A0ABQ8TVP3_PERAM|nr:hypothetical protein ANN_01320 [Periplaneta americana]